MISNSWTTTSIVAIFFSCHPLKNILHLFGTDSASHKRETGMLKSPHRDQSGSGSILLEPEADTVRLPVNLALEEPGSLFVEDAPANPLATGLPGHEDNPPSLASSGLPTHPIVQRAQERLRQRRDELHRQCEQLRKEPPQLHAELCRATAEFHRLHGPRWCGFSSMRDYCAERLGVSTSQFYRWVRQYHLLQDAPTVTALHAEGILSESALAEIAQALTPAQAEAAVPELIDLNIRELRRRLAEIRAAADALVATTLDAAASNEKEETTTAASSEAAAGSSAAAASLPFSSISHDTRGIHDSEAHKSEAREHDASGRDTRDSDTREHNALDHVVRIHVPSAFAPYIENTLRLGEALIGSEGDDEMRLGAVLAEASSEIEFTVSAAEALRRLMPAPRRRNPFAASPPPPPAIPLHRSRSSSPFSHTQESSAEVANASHRLEFAEPADALHNSDATSPNQPADGELRTSGQSLRHRTHSLDLLLRRLLARRRRLGIRHEDQVLRFQDDSAHALLFYPRFDLFAREELGLPPSTVFEMLDRARQRRHSEPIALAHARGTITALQATLLRQLPRIGVPRGDLARWIDTAAHLSVRALRDRISWARHQTHLDYRAWSLAGCPPPTDEELRTSRQSLRELAAHPTPPSILESSPHAYRQHATLQWILSEDTTIFLAQELASIQDHATRDGHPPCPPWAALVILCHHARRAWSQMEKPRSKKEEAVLDRDDWRCAVPGCSSRRSLQRHHIVFTSRGGGNEAENLVSLCAFHHLIGVHQGLIRVRGKARPGAENLFFEMGLRPGGRPLAIYRGDHRCPRHKAQR